jgi:hypothetical protein
MKLSVLLIINAVVILVYAVGALFVPATMLTMYGMTPGAGEQLMTRFFGVSMLALGLLSWLVRNSHDAGLRRAVIPAFLVFNAAGVVVSLLGTLSKVMSPLGWQVVAIYLLFCLGFGYLQFAKPNSE